MTRASDRATAPRLVPLRVIERRRERNAREILRNEIALRAIRQRLDRRVVMALLELSPSAYERLAGQARA